MSEKHTPGPWRRLEQRLIVAGHGASLPICEVWPGGVGADQADANEMLITAGPDLLRELQAAHQIIRNALGVMTLEQKAEWGKRNLVDGVDGEGITRANERAAVLAAATRSPA